MACKPLVYETVDADNTIPVVVLNINSKCGWNCIISHGDVNRMVVILSSSHIPWYSTCIDVITVCPVQAKLMSGCDTPTSQRPTNHSVLFELTHMLIIRSSMSTRHICTNFHVSISFGSSALTEQAITLTLLVTQEISLLGLCVCHLSGNVINYWW